jgi:hypothetical protein
MDVRSDRVKENLYVRIDSRDLPARVKQGLPLSDYDRVLSALYLPVSLSIAVAVKVLV